MSTTALARLVTWLAAGGALAPGAAAACATCVSSAYGDQTYNWPYLALILMPFLVSGAVGAVLYRYRRTLPSSDVHPTPADTPPPLEIFLDKETT